MRYIYNDTGNGVHPDRGLSTDSQPAKIFPNFVNDRLINFIVEETDVCHQNVKDKLTSESKLIQK
jgi:hypothetical protein